MDAQSELQALGQAQKPGSYKTYISGHKNDRSKAEWENAMNEYHASIDTYRNFLLSQYGREQDLQQYEREKRDALTQWQRQNEYDLKISDPAFQLQRLKAAGVNPNFGISSLGSANGQAMSMPSAASYPTPSADATGTAKPGNTAPSITDYLNTLNSSLKQGTDTYYQAKQFQLQSDLVSEQIEHQRIQNEMSRNALLKNALESEWLRHLSPSDRKTITDNLTKLAVSQSNTQLLQSQFDASRFQNDSDAIKFARQAMSKKYGTDWSQYYQAKLENEQVQRDSNRFSYEAAREQVEQSRAFKRWLKVVSQKLDTPSMPVLNLIKDGIIAYIMQTGNFPSFIYK